MTQAKSMLDEQIILAKESFKQNARIIALEKSVIISNGNWDTASILADAEKIYQWLIKDL
jgi:hypothetical protein